MRKSWALFWFRILRKYRHRSKILVLTKYRRRQNIGVDKILASTKYLRCQNVGIDKILALTKCWRRQNIGIDKILALTKCCCRQNTRVDKILAQRQKDPLTVWLGRVHSCWLLPGPTEDLMMVLHSLHAVVKCVVASSCPAFKGGLSSLLYRLIVPARHAENVKNFGADKISASA